MIVESFVINRLQKQKARYPQKRIILYQLSIIGPTDDIINDQIQLTRILTNTIFRSGGGGATIIVGSDYKGAITNKNMHYSLIRVVDIGGGSYFLRSSKCLFLLVKLHSFA